MKTPRTRPRRLLHLAGPLAVLAALPASAQTANPASNATSNTAADTPSNAAAEATVDLQPFEVSDTATTGYQTNETLAGTRLRTNLADIASSLLVFTPDMLNDLAATNEMDVMRYSSAAEQDRTDQTAAVQDILPLQGVFNFRIRGEAATRALNYFETNIIPDTFDTETIEEANGPNAILFGSGAAGGIYNTSTKRASIGQDATVLGIVLSSDQDTRATVDINRTVVPDHLALRVNVLDEHGQGWQPYADSNNLGAALAATWKPTDRLSVTVNSLYEDISEPMTRDFAPFDEVSLWRASGSPEVATGQITATPALAAEGITARAAGMEDVTFVGNSGSYRNFQGTAVSLPESPTANASNNTLFPSVWYQVDPSDPYPQNANFSGPGARVNDVEGGYQMSVDFEPLDHLFLDFSSDYDALQNHIYDWVASEGYGTSYDSVFGEPGQTFRDGSPNPYVGDYYIDGRWVYRDTFTYSTRYRLTADYELDAGKAWGRHSLVGLLSRDFTAAPATTEFLGLAGSPFNASPFAPANLIYVRQYISNPSDLYQWAVPSWQQIVNQPVSVTLNKGAAPSTYQAVYTSDHGEMMGSHGHMGKQMPHEESCRVPFIVRLPGMEGRGRASDALFASVDIYPTLCGLAGIPVPRHCSGRDYSSLMRGEASFEEPERVFLMNEQGPPTRQEVDVQTYRGVRTKTHTYAVQLDGRWCLYDNAADPYQMKNLVRDPAYGPLIDKFDRALMAWSKSTGDSFPYDRALGSFSSYPAA